MRQQEDGRPVRAAGRHGPATLARMRRRENRPPLRCATSEYGAARISLRRSNRVARVCGNRNGRPIKGATGFAPALGFQEPERGALPAVGLVIEPDQGKTKLAGAERSIDDPIDQVLHPVCSGAFIHGRVSRIRLPLMRAEREADDGRDANEPQQCR